MQTQFIFSDKFNQEDMQLFNYHVNLEKIGSTIRIDISSPTFEHFFLLVKDPNKKIRALITFKTTIYTYFISEEFSLSSNLTRHGKLEGGIWEFIVIRPYRMSGDFTVMVDTDCVPPINDMPISLENIDKNIQYALNQSIENLDVGQWFLGDLHLHSTFSDGGQTAKDVCNEIERQKFDYVFLTDHSIIPTKSYKTNVCVIPSTEITFDDDGHINVFGVDYLIDYSTYFKEKLTKDELLYNLITDLKTKNTVISINHPFLKQTAFRHDLPLALFNCIEIMNSPYIQIEHDYNRDAVNFFDYLWSKGWRIFGVGGSDSHKPFSNGMQTIGQPKTAIYAESLTINNLLDALRLGRNYVVHEDELTLSIRSNNTPVLPGAYILGDVQYEVETLNRYQWRLIHNGNVVETCEGARVTFNFKVNSGDFFRVEAIDCATGRLRIFINPIHALVKQPEPVTWMEALNSYRVELE